MTNDREVERLMDLVGALVQANVAQVQHCTKHKAFSEELGTQQRAAYIAVQDELERLVADARRMEFLHDKCSVSFMFRRTDGTNAMVQGPIDLRAAIDAALSSNPPPQEQEPQGD